MTSSEAANDAPAVRWADSYCGSVTHLVDAVSTVPTVDTSSPTRAADSSSALLNTVLGGLDNTLQGLSDLDSSPVGGGNELRDKTVGSLTGIRDQIADAKRQLDAAGDNSEEGNAAITAATEPLQEISRMNLMDGMSSVPDLARASGQAPHCQQLAAEPPEMTQEGQPAPG